MTDTTVVATEQLLLTHGTGDDLFSYTGDGGDLGPVITPNGYQGDGGDLGPIIEAGQWRSVEDAYTRDLTRRVLESWSMADAFAKGPVIIFLEELTLAAASALRDLTRRRGSAVQPADDDLRNLTTERTEAYSPSSVPIRSLTRDREEQLTVAFATLLRAAWRVASDFLDAADTQARRLLVRRRPDELVPVATVQRDFTHETATEALQTSNDPLLKALTRRVAADLVEEDGALRDLVRRRGSTLTPADDDFRRLVTEATVTLQSADALLRDMTRRPSVVLDVDDGDRRDIVRTLLEALDMSALVLRSLTRSGAEDLTLTNEDEQRDHTRPQLTVLQPIDDGIQRRTTERSETMTAVPATERDLQRDNFEQPSLQPDDAVVKSPTRTRTEDLTEQDEEHPRHLYRPRPAELTQADARERELTRRRFDQLTVGDDDFRDMVRETIEMLNPQDIDGLRRVMFRRTPEGALLSDSMERVMWRERDEDISVVDDDRRDATRIVAEALLQYDGRVRDIVRQTPELLEPITTTLRDLVRRTQDELTPTADDRPLVGRYRQPPAVTMNTVDDDRRDAVRIVTETLDLLAGLVSQNIIADRDQLRKDSQSLAWVMATWANRKYAYLLHEVVDALKEERREC